MRDAAEGYQGSYPVELARGIISEKGDAFLNMPPGDAVRELGR